jgi:hypothetical protein
LSAFSNLTRFAFGFLVFQGIDQFDGQEAADFPAMALDGLNP